MQDLIAEKQDKLLQRRLDRIEWLGWTLLTTGQFSVFTKNNVLAHQGAYTLQQYTATVPWATSASRDTAGRPLGWCSCWHAGIASTWALRRPPG